MLTHFLLDIAEEQHRIRGQHWDIHLGEGIKGGGRSVTLQEPGLCIHTT
jgi:hypothetical protein